MLLEKPKGTKYITRCDYPRTHGWWVRILDNRNGKGKVSKFFRDTKYESKEEGLAAAIKFRDKYYKKMTRAEKTIMSVKARKDKIYGEGVYLIWNKRGEFQYAHICASWHENGKQHKKSFSVNKYGYKKAQAMAKKIRKEMTKHKIDCRK